MPSGTIIFPLFAALITPLASAATLGLIDNFSQNGESFRLHAAGSQEETLSLTSGTLLTDWTRGFGVEANLIPVDRSVSAEILDEHGLFVLSYGPGVDAQTWLSYLAPEGESFDLTIQNAANKLALMVEFSQASFQIEVTVESPGGLRETHSFFQETNLIGQEIEIPFEVFTSVDLAKITELHVEINNDPGKGAPDVVLSQISVEGDNIQSVPEPSSLLLILLATTGLLGKRRREVL